MRRIWLYGWFLLLTVALAAAQPNDACAPLAAAAAQAKAVRQKLVAFEVAPMDTTVPKDAIPTIAALKEALAATADAAVHCAALDADAKVLEQQLAAALEANQPEKPESPPVTAETDWNKLRPGSYGSELHVAVARPVAFPRLLTVVLTFDVACGSDSMLLVYEPQGTAWRRVIRWQSKPYTGVNGAFGDFFEYVFVPQPGGRWALTAAHGCPWCTSRFSGFKLDVLGPGATQHAIFHMEHDYSRGGEVALKPTQEGFDLRLDVIPVDLDTMARMGIFRYRVAGETVERIQPVAMNGRDFVDEWLQADWAEAARWTDEKQVAALKDLRENLMKHRHDEHSGLITYGPTRACTGDPNHFQVELDEDSGATRYFQIEQGKNSFTLLNAGRKPDARCTGPDLMKRRPAAK